MKFKSRLVMITIIVMILFVITDFIFYKTRGSGLYAQVKVPILMYHNISSSYPAAQGSINITPEGFEEHMSALKEAGYTTITFEDYYNHIRKNAFLPHKSIIITFDDGYRSNYQYAYPILKKMNMKATIFVVTSLVGQDIGDLHYLTWDQAREMENSKVVDIQCHSHKHLDMTKLSLEDAREDLALAQKTVKKEMGKEFTVLSWPHGFYNKQLESIAKSEGFDMQAVIQRNGKATKKVNLSEMERIMVEGSFTGADLVQKVRKHTRRIERLHMMEDKMYGVLYSKDKK